MLFFVDTFLLINSSIKTLSLTVVVVVFLCTVPTVFLLVDGSDPLSLLVDITHGIKLELPLPIPPPPHPPSITQA